MRKIKIFGTIGIFGMLFLALGIAFSINISAQENVQKMSWLDDYPDYEDYLSGNDNEDAKTKEVILFTDEECIDTIYGTYIKGRWVKREIYEVDKNGNVGKLIKTKFEEWTPSSIERKTIKAIKVGEKDTNEWCDSLVGFLNDYIKSPTGSYESFCDYINYLVNDFGMYEEEAESFRYKWRYERNSLTDDEKAKLDKEEQERLEQEQKRQEELDKALEEIINAGIEASKNKKTLFQKELNMILRNLPPYITIDESQYIILREKGLSYVDAYEQSITINYEKALEYSADKMIENKDWYGKQTEILTSDSFQQTMENIGNKLLDFFKELVGEDTENTEEGESA